MAKIAIDQAPPPALPRRFLLSAPLWGAFAGALLLFEGETLLQTRWAPATLAAVHALTLGLLGNAMFGSLLQFLPAAAGVRVRGGMPAGRCLHALLNLGTLALVCGLHSMQPVLLAAGALALSAAFALLALLALPGLMRAGAQRLLHAGIGAALLAGLATAVLGAGMACTLAGHDALSPLRWVDVHAAWGVAGWCLGLVAAVAAVVMPMFQGTRTLADRARVAWLVVLLGGLLAGSAALILRDQQLPLRAAVVLAAALLALGGLSLQARAQRARNAWLVRSWRAGFLALLAAALSLALEGPPVLSGVLALGIGLPWLVAGMQLEIVSFLGWIELQRTAPRGTRVPSMQVLLPEAHKAGVFIAQALAAAALLLAAAFPNATGARLAGAALCASQALLWWRLRGVGQAVRTRFDPRQCMPSQPA